VPDLATLGIFCTATLALVGTPGPGVLYIVARSLDGGRRAGFASMLGIQSAELVYIAAAAAGLSALLATSVVALSVMRYAGAAYLIVMGIRQWRDAHRADLPRASEGRLLARGFAVQLLNPKVAVFFVAYFPQFIDPNGSIVPQILVLGGVYLLIALASDTAYVLLTSSAARRIARNADVRRRVARLSAATYVGLGMYTALSGGRPATARA
jgi:threonine/homoserine/homoserine lactone efflux protein